MTIEDQRNNIDITAVLKKCGQALDDKKAEETVIVNISKVNPYFDYFIITTGSSVVHCKALAREVRQCLYSQGVKERGKPDLNSGWIVLDFNDIVIHIFTEEMRAYYKLEKLWADGDRVKL
ncbi:MAG: ribosome silencing factor [Spirochaetae bacterium HGW-Spirochaetae-1]|jgi:ribosome-associated protein|nr:MAG: ribosome silencing factor [Spirochaetae bacterium HGW-Spirochaetae-1]